MRDWFQANIIKTPPATFGPTARHHFVGRAAPSIETQFPFTGACLIYRIGFIFEAVPCLVSTSYSDKAPLSTLGACDQGMVPKHSTYVLKGRNVVSCPSICIVKLMACTAAYLLPLISLSGLHIVHT